MSHSSAHLDPRDFLKNLYQAAVRRAQPSHVMANFMPTPPKGRTVVVGAGKAAGAMALAFEELWLIRYPDAAMRGLVVTRYGHTPPVSPALQALRDKASSGSESIKIIEAAHPVPDAAGLAAAEQILQSVQGLTQDDLVVCLISGGGSSLLTLPCEGLSFPEKQAINQALLMSGANIGEMNCVRKHLSRIKGGRLAAACGAARLVTLAISDVPGDDVSVIASGPTVLDETTCADALAILTKYAIALPANIHAALQAGGLETPKGIGLQGKGANQVQLIATPQQSLEAAADAARALGITPYILSDEIEGESREVAKVHAALAISTARGRSSFKTPCVILSGGETTVTVRPRAEGQVKGKGGRAGEFCLGLALALNGAKGIYALAADTDGIDGVEDNAGAFVMPDTLQRAKQQALGVSDHLARNDAYRFFAGLNDLLVTGPTHTNVNDFRAIYVASQRDN
ncbi:MAG: glycerate kinase [Cytophagales bacterium]|nr:glycerate kinase [Cytophagales bacterium]